jgi:hypothetical protein
MREPAHRQNTIDTQEKPIMAMEKTLPNIDLEAPSARISAATRRG